jgi:hypothetical protein
MESDLFLWTIFCSKVIYILLVVTMLAISQNCERMYDRNYIVSVAFSTE